MGLDYSVFDKAADLIETQGWAQGGARRRAGYCAGGAVAKVVSGDARAMYGDGISESITPEQFAMTESYILYMANHLPPLAESHCRIVYTWNDTAGRRQFEVIKFLRSLAQGESND